MSVHEQVERDGKFLRQLDIFDPSKHQKAVTIIGAGGIGGPAAFQLAKLGIDDLKVIDFDKVEEHNQPNQMFTESQIAMKKVEALRDVVTSLTGVTLRAICDKVETERRLPVLNGIVISAVDSMEARKAIFERTYMNPACELLIDGRMGGEVMSVYTINTLDRDQREAYAKTLVADKDTVELPCTARAVIDVGFMIGALITRAVRRYCVDGAYMFEVILDHKNLMFINRERAPEEE